MFLDVDLLYIKKGPLELLHIGVVGWLQILRLGSGLAAALCLANILLERTLATYLSKTYENLQNLWFPLVLILLNIIAAISGTILFFGGKFLSVDF